MSSILQQGRLHGTNRKVTEFISSLQDDKRIYRATVLVNEAHVLALAKGRIIDRKSAKQLLSALRKLENHQNILTHNNSVEDIHVLIEEMVVRLVGKEVGGKLHTGKSRNDQVATAIRIVTLDSIIELSRNVLRLQNVLLNLSKKHMNTFFVGYTHMQPAQPITFAHYLLAFLELLGRDIERLFFAYTQTNRSPLGAGAIAGSSFPISRKYEAELLGFSSVLANSLDAVTTRDFLLETISFCAILASNLSHIAADLIFYSSADVNMIELADEYTSTSSIMPQKKNPDPLELIRAKTALVNGQLTSAFTILHGLPSGYNLDFQELTPLLWKSFDTLNQIIIILSGLFTKIRVNRNIAKRLTIQLTVATEIANLLVQKEQIPFREAHRLVGKIVRSLVENNQTFQDVSQRGSWQNLIGLHLKPGTEKLLSKVVDPIDQLFVYRTMGGANPRETEAMFRKAQKQTREYSRMLSTKLEARIIQTITRNLHSASLRDF